MDNAHTGANTFIAGAKHLLHRLTARFPLLPIGLLAVLSHLLVYAWSYHSSHGLVVTVVLWMLALALFAWEVKRGFDRAQDSADASAKHPWLAVPEHRGDGTTPGFAARLRRALSFSSPLVVITITGVGLLAVTLAVKYVSIAAFVCTQSTCVFDLVALFWIVMGTLLLGTILFGYRPGAYGAMVQRPSQHQPTRPYLVILLSIENVNTEESEARIRQFYGLDGAVAIGEAPVDDYFRLLLSDKAKSRIPGAIAHLWRGIVPHASKGTLRRVYVITSGESSKAFSIGVLRRCYEAYRVAGGNSPTYADFKIVIVHQGMGGIALATPLDDFAPSTQGADAEARDGQFEDVASVARALRAVEADISQKLPWRERRFHDIGEKLAIDITGGQKMASTIGLLHGYGRPMLAQYVQTASPFSRICYDLNPKPGPHF